MDLLGKASEVTETTASTVTDAKEAASETSTTAKETAIGALGTAAEKTPAHAEAAAERLTDTGAAVAQRLPAVRTDSARWTQLLGAESAARSVAVMPYERFSSLDVSIQESAQQFSSVAMGAVQEVDLERTFRFGRQGLKYGKVYGDYVPVAGDFLPHAGFAAGVGMGLLESADLLSAEDLVELSTALSAVAAEFIREEGQSLAEDGDAATDALSEVAAEQSSSVRTDEVLEMNYDEFAGKN